MNSTCGALTTEISNVLVNVGPINSGARQLFHLLNTKVSLVQQGEDATLKFGRDHSL